MYETALSGCDMLDTQKNYKFREQVLPFYMETTIVILVTLSNWSSVWNVDFGYKRLTVRTPASICFLVALSIYSFVTNVTLKITSERHQANYGLD